MTSPRTSAAASTTPPSASSPNWEHSSGLAVLVGSGSKIGLVTLPFLLGAVVLRLARPALVAVGGPSAALRLVSVAVLAVGLVVWAWCVVLILRTVPRGALITTGPYAVVKHPLYTGFAVLVLPWAGFLLDTWLGAVVGFVLYLASRRYVPEEEAVLARRFGATWEDHSRNVLIPWL